MMTQENGRKEACPELTLIHGQIVWRQHGLKGNNCYHFHHHKAAPPPCVSELRAPGSLSLRAVPRATGLVVCLFSGSKIK
jgi:hypothetical protein